MEVQFFIFVIQAPLLIMLLSVYPIGLHTGPSVMIDFTSHCTLHSQSAGIGWQITAARYRQLILDIFGHMSNMRGKVRPENRTRVDYYLSQVWPTGFRLALSLRPPSGLPHGLEDRFEDYRVYEEERIRNNLRAIKYDIDAPETVYTVAGPGRLETVSTELCHTNH